MPLQSHESGYISGHMEGYDAYKFEMDRCFNRCERF
jgi:hypothetical protein